MIDSRIVLVDFFFIFSPSAAGSHRYMAQCCSWDIFRDPFVVAFDQSPLQNLMGLSILLKGYFACGLHTSRIEPATYTISPVCHSCISSFLPQRKGLKYIFTKISCASHGHIQLHSKKSLNIFI